MARNWWLIAGGVLSAIGALIHVAAPVAGPDWYRFFGAGEETARAAQRGSPVPALMALGIAGLLAAWAAYAFAGAGLIRRLPLMRTALVLISAVYLLRGLVLVPALALNRDGVTGFTLWSSLIVLGYGVAYAAGTWKAWPALSRAAGGG
ncbi:MAG: hypothetical protein ICV73_22080 [Acetobacteraceae bacterium]|nr:hypothetical protein [Acetobacteraceae bacterium]